MKKLMMMTLCLLILLPGCKGKGSSAEAAGDNQPVKESVPRPEKEAVTLFVSNMYKDIGAVFADESIPFSQKTDFNQKYGSKDWKSKVEAIVKHDRNLDEPGFFEADPWIMGQDVADFYATDIKVERVEDSKASVTLKLHNSDYVTNVKVLLVMEEEWKVDNLIDLTNNFDWKTGMKEYLEEVRSK